MTGTVEIELRAALAALEHARDELAHATTPELRGVVYREIGTAEICILRCLHLIAGTVSH